MLAKALGQCQSFIARHFPTVSLTKTTSTAAAAQALLHCAPDCAAICSKICATLFDGLSVIREGIQDDAGVFHAKSSYDSDLTRPAANFTRFFIIAEHSEAKLPNCPQPTRALVQISTKIPSSMFAGTTVQNTNVSHLLTALQLSTTRIDRRPAIGTVPFHDTYIIEVEQEGNTQNNSPWVRKVEVAMERVKHAGGNGRLIGLW